MAVIRHPILLGHLEELLCHGDVPSLTTHAATRQRTRKVQPREEEQPQGCLGEHQAGAQAEARGGVRTTRRLNGELWERWGMAVTSGGPPTVPQMLMQSLYNRGEGI
jgi:hypothetical protein